MFDALVFDLDGTLWDASEASTHGWNNGLRSLNINRTISVVIVRAYCNTPLSIDISLIIQHYLVMLYVQLSHRFPNLCSKPRPSSFDRLFQPENRLR